MSLRSSLLVALVLSGSVLAPQVGAQAADAPLPFDSTVLRGRLPNGLRYLIRRNTLPENRAELRLVVDAGSILEDEPQLGVAHFVEHMAFNGTRRFPKADLVNFLERTGVRFGPDLNAYTSFDETVYMLQVPTDTAAIVSKALDILEDWAHGLALDSAEIRKERGVVVEEWRSGRGAQMRMTYKQFPVILRGSKYATRLPIGTRENLQSFPDSVARAFYRDWYRPDLMTVVAVGDFDPKQMEADVKQRFARIPAVAKPRKREYAQVPGHEETYVSIESDKEYPSAGVTLAWFGAPKRTRTTADFRRSLVNGFHDRMVSARLSEISQRPDAPFAYGGMGRGSFTRTRDVLQLYAGVKGSDFVKAADALLAEAERVRRFGFTATELDRARTNYLRGLEQRFAERDKTNSSAFAGQYVLERAQRDAHREHRRRAEARAAVRADGHARRAQRARPRLLPEAGSRRHRGGARTSPRSSCRRRAEMLAVFDRPADSSLTAYVDSTSDAPLVATPPTPGKVVSETKLPETGILEWRLSNGARVLLKPSDFKRDEVLFAAQSPGGISLLPDTVVTQGELASMALSVGGLGTFNQTSLTKRLAGKRASVSAFISDTEQGLQGNASAKDIETLFQLAWLNMSQPRADSSAFAALRNQARSVLANQRNDPGSIFRDTVTMVMSQHHPRTRLFVPELFDSVDVRRSLAIHQDRFADAGAFTFFLVGSFNADSVRPLVERYLASLPAAQRSEKARDVGIRPPNGIVNTTVRAGIEPKAQNLIVFSGPCEYSIENRTVMSALRELMDIRLREVLREDKGGTYGAGVSANCSHIPYSNYRVSVQFGSAPERTEELTKEVFSVIESIKQGEVSDSNMTKIRELTIRGHETALKQNNRWLGAMMDADEDGRDQRDFLRTTDRMLKVTKEQIRDAARLYLRTDRYARFTLLPAEAEKKMVP